MPHVTILADPSGASARLMVGRIMRVTGRAMVGGFAVVLGAAGLVVVVLLVVNQPAAEFVAMSVMPVSGFALGVGQLLALTGRDLVTQAEILIGLTIRIDDVGIGWTGPRSGTSIWDDLEHVVFTASRPGSRRMRLVAAGAAAASNPYELVPVGQMRRAFRPDRYLLDVPIDRLDRPAEQLFQLVQLASAGRFPDLYSPSQFSFGTGDADE
jgi:hypothetical protein